MDNLVMVSTMMILVLFASSGSARAATLLVSNQMQTRSNVSVFVTCEGSTLKLSSKSVPLGKVLLVEIPPTAGNNATGEKAAGSRVWQWANCVGKFNGEPHFWPSGFELLYDLYDLHEDSGDCKNVFLVAAKDDGFYSWNNDKNAWDKSHIHMII